MTVLLYLAALSTCLVGGLFFAFSVVVMRALARLDEREGMAAMQSINVVVLNPWFFAAFFGAGAQCLLAAGAAWFVEPGLPRLLALIGAACYLVGCILVTGARNVPLNDRLADADPAAAGSARFWALYLDQWTRWNHVRTAASMAAAAAFVAAAGTA